MQKLLSIFVYLILLIFLESAAEVTGVPASAPAELPEEPNYVALTFDDGPRRGTTARLLDGLRERGASATFFLVGERLAGNEDLVLRMQAEGHQVGTHTWSHIRLDGTAPAAQLRDIQAAQNAVCKLLDTDSCWLRPPYGLIDPAVRTGVTVPMVHWSVDPRDWESRDTAMVVRFKGRTSRRHHPAARYLPLLRGGGASDRGRAGGGGVLVCYSGRASGAERHPAQSGGYVPVRAGVAQYCRTTATTLPRI